MRCKRILATAVLLLLLPMCFVASAQDEPFAVLRAAVAPQLDGELDAEEWGQALYTVQPSDQGAYVQRYTDKIELPDEMQVYMMWDEEYLYLAVQVQGIGHHNTQTDAANAWNGHAVMLTLQGSKGQDRLSLALGADGAVLCGAHHRGNKKDVDAPSQAHTGAVMHTGDTTVYEMRVQWSELLYNKAPKSGEELSFSVAAHLADAEDGTYAGAFLLATDNADGLTLPTLRFDEGQANADFDPAATTTTTQTETTQSTTTTTTKSSAFTLPDAPTMKWVLIGCLGGALLTLTVVLIVVICRRK